MMETIMQFDTLYKLLDSMRVEINSIEKDFPHIQSMASVYTTKDLTELVDEMQTTMEGISYSPKDSK